MRNVLLVLTNLLLLVFVMSCARPMAPAASEGIKVHGDWEVTVSDPGTGEKMVYEFSNDLVPKSGAAVLALALRGEGLAEAPDGTNKMSIFFYDEKNSLVCSTGESSFLYQAMLFVKHTSYLQTTGVRIKGTCTVPSEGKELAKVVTVLVFDPSKAPSIDSFNKALTNGPLTQKYLDDPIPLTLGQLLSATVNITFE